MKFYDQLKDIEISDGIYPAIINEAIEKLLENNKFNKIKWEKWLDVPVLNNSLLLEDGIEIEQDLDIDDNLNAETINIENDINIDGDLEVGEEFKINGKSPLELAYPVGSVYMTTTDNTPSHDNLLGFGEWERFGEGRVLVGDDPDDSDFDASNNSEGGEKEVELTGSEMPEHTHESIITGSSSNHRHGYTEITARTSKTNGFAGNYALLASARRTVYTSGPVSDSGEHSHNITTQETGFNEPHNNLQPYVVVHMWKRTN